MELAALLLPVLIFLFMFLSFIFSRNIKISAVSRKIEKFNRKISLNQKPRFYEDMRMLLKNESRIKVLGIKVNNLEKVFLLQILLASAFLITMNLLGILLSRNLFVWSLVGSAIAYFLPITIIKGFMDKKGRSVLVELPDIIEITSSLIEAGLTLDEAIKYISLNYKGSISKLFALLQVKKLEGHTRAEAFKIISRLSFCEDFKTVIKLMAQSEEIGNPIAEVLSDLSTSLRNNQRDKLKIRAERMESNLVLVIFIFLFIPMLMIFMLPVLPQIRLLF